MPWFEYDALTVGGAVMLILVVLVGITLVVIRSP